MKAIGLGRVEPLDQAPFPVLPKDRRLEFQLLGSKWHHAEEEFVVRILAKLALLNDGWCSVSWKDLAKEAKKWPEIRIDPVLSLTIHNMVDWGDVEVFQSVSDNEVYVKPLPELGITIAKSEYSGWNR